MSLRFLTSLSCSVSRVSRTFRFFTSAQITTGFISLRRIEDFATRTLVNCSQYHVNLHGFAKVPSPPNAKLFASKAENGVAEWLRSWRSRSLFQKSARCKLIRHDARRIPGNFSDCRNRDNSHLFIIKWFAGICENSFHDLAFDLLVPTPPSIEMINKTVEIRNHVRAGHNSN